MGHVFISYSKDDVDRARLFADLLGQKGWPVWWDPHIPVGETWAEVIEKQLKDADCVLVLWSRNSVDSRWVKKEARHAFENGRLIPALIDDVPIPFEFEDVEYARLIDWQGESVHELDLLLTRVNELAGTPVPPSTERAEQRRASGQRLIEGGETDRGIEQLEKALTEFEMGGDWSGAEAALDTLLQRDPDNMAYRVRRIEHAARSRDRNMELLAYIEMARLHNRTGDEAAARTAYGRVLAIDPSNHEAKTARGGITSPTRAFVTGESNLSRREEPVTAEVLNTETVGKRRQSPPIERTPPPHEKATRTKTRQRKSGKLRAVAWMSSVLVVGGMGVGMWMFDELPIEIQRVLLPVRQLISSSEATPAPQPSPPPPSAAARRVEGLRSSVSNPSVPLERLVSALNAIETDRSALDGRDRRFLDSAGSAVRPVAALWDSIKIAQGSGTLVLRDEISLLERFRQSDGFRTGSPEDSESGTRLRQVRRAAEGLANLTAPSKFRTCSRVVRNVCGGDNTSFQVRSAVFAWAQVNSPSRQQIRFEWRDQSGSVLHDFRTYVDARTDPAGGYRTHATHTFRERGEYQVRVYNRDDYLVGLKKFTIR